MLHDAAAAVARFVRREPLLCFTTLPATVSFVLKDAAERHLSGWTVALALFVACQSVISRSKVSPLTGAAWPPPVPNPSTTTNQPEGQ